MSNILRLFLKAICWETLGIITLFIIGLCTVSNIKEFGLATGLFYISRILMFVGHEIVWDGKKLKNNDKVNRR